MPTTLRQASQFNVRATINASFGAAHAGLTYPAGWFTTAPTVRYIPTQTAVAPPMYSLFHFEVDSEDRYNGAGDGTYAVTLDTGLLEISAWVTQDGNPKWLPQLNTMSDLIKTWALTSSSVVVKDYAASQTAPSSTQYLVRIDGGARLVETLPDKDNPALQRARFLISYRWHFRA